ncbi:MAG: GNAT family N-acetyltransferase [Candidatus Dactylopiibacterium carminicum]|uniref:N-acetyltransferase n=1 Tax=Candidatus Dactylopiibacterium carminicum TaxID=857335 RepID=A0A272EY54_9RHOO|nr:GNAT family N-acetyltransferase [Candidatus Dactylopiibacterium carminicum]KAF7600422.1 N-acetyltransferase [Candidatus Dactylopiibacterium carminicum]PAS95043.1 MAG: GNAT family N-acetyltransferase [Candidatus Dactylopiibacterium carminicum]PAS97848.1 MAG: GNAT family N-acetyltransferase [Candidatus Dactylopiibacterium carminicum]PAT00421.1 MAG: hypothetical protein BSR46_02455 [Candidatus Dactylopiibacterium carminicum]
MSAPALPLLRPARAEDIPAIAGLLAALFAIESDFSADSTRQQAALSQMLDRADILLQVAELDGAVVGFCSVQTVISTAEGGPAGVIEDVVVAATHRGKGIARALLAAAEAWALGRGMLRLQLLADQDNAPALAFYRHLGWQETQLGNWRKRLRG